MQRIKESKGVRQVKQTLQGGIAEFFGIVHIIVSAGLTSEKDAMPLVYASQNIWLNINRLTEKKWFYLLEMGGYGDNYAIHTGAGEMKEVFKSYIHKSEANYKVNGLATLAVAEGKQMKRIVAVGFGNLEYIKNILSVIPDVDYFISVFEYIEFDFSKLTTPNRWLTDIIVEMKKEDQYPKEQESLQLILTELITHIREVKENRKQNILLLNGWKVAAR